MKKFFMTAIMAVAALAASAQKGEYKITPHVGVGYAHMSNLEMPSPIQIGDKPSMLNFANALGVTVGADFEYMVADKVGLSAGVDYLFTKSDVISESVYFEGNTVETGDMYYSFSYINVPILAQYHLGHFAIKAGLQPGFMVNSKYSEDGKKVSLKDGMKTVSLALPVGVSYEFKRPVVLDLRCAIPLTRQNKESIKDGNMRLTTVLLTAGYRF